MRTIAQIRGKRDKGRSYLNIPPGKVKRGGKMSRRSTTACSALACMDEALKWRGAMIIVRRSSYMRRDRCKAQEVALSVRHGGL